MRHSIVFALALLTATPTAAEVAASSESGFVSHNEALVRASPTEAWAALVQPGQWVKWTLESDLSRSFLAVY